MNSIKIITEDTPFSGSGHIARQKVLSKALISKNFDVSIVVNPSNLYSEIYQSEPTKYLILDLSFQTQNSIVFQQLIPSFTIFLDWINAFIPDVNISIYQQPNFKYSAKYLIKTGLKYFCFDNEYNKTQSDYFLVFLGNTAPASEYKKVIDYIFNIYGDSIPIVAVIGEYSEFKSRNSKITIIKKPFNFLELLSNCKKSFLNGGSTLLQSLIIGKISHSFPQNEFEFNFVNFLLSKGFKINMDYQKHNNHFFHSNLIAKKIYKLDGGGASRFIRLIESLPDAWIK